MSISGFRNSSRGICLTLFLFLLCCIGAVADSVRTLNDTDDAILARLTPALQAHGVLPELQQEFLQTLRAALSRVDDDAYAAFVKNSGTLHENFKAYLEALASGALQLSGLEKKHIHFWVYAIVTQQISAPSAVGEREAVETARALGERVFAPAIERALEALPADQRARWQGELDGMPAKLTENVIEYVRRCQAVRMFPANRRGIDPTKLDEIATGLIEKFSPPNYGEVGILMTTADETYRDALINYVKHLGVSVRGELLIRSLYPECNQAPWLPADGLSTLSSDSDGLPLVGLKLRQEQGPLP